MAPADEPDALLEYAASFDDHEADERWEAIREFQRHSDPATFEAARRFVLSADERRRVVGIDALADFGVSAGRPLATEAIQLLISVCDDYRPAVLAAAVVSLGHHRDERALPTVLRLVSHPSDEVRFAVAVALPAVAGDPPEDGAVDALLRLCEDSDSEVRDWATFGLGSQLDVDTPAVREALLRRLEDAEGDTAGEALVGLANRGDLRALPWLLKMLEDEPGNLIVEAAAALRAPEALPALRRLKREGWEEDEPNPSILDEAIAACSASDRCWRPLLTARQRLATGDPGPERRQRRVRHRAGTQPIS